MLRRGLLGYEWAILWLTAGIGMAWGIVSLFALQNMSFPPSGVTTVIAWVFFLPVFLAGRVGAFFPFSHGPGFVCLSSTLFGFVAGMVMVMVFRWRDF